MPSREGDTIDALVSHHRPPSLESFHPQRRNRPVDNTKLTRGEASHFITTAIAAEEDGSEEEEERGLEEGIEDATSPRGLPL